MDPESVAGGEFLPRDRQLAGDHLQPGIAAGSQRVLYLVARLERRGKQLRVLVDVHGTIFVSARRQQLQLAFALRSVKALLRVGGLESLSFWEEPDLQQMHRVRGRRVVLAVQD